MADIVDGKAIDQKRSTWHPKIELKVVGNEKEGGSGRWQMIRNWYQTAGIEVCLSLNFAVVFDFVNFRFRQVKHI